jgi:hypothetical protein
VRSKDIRINTAKAKGYTVDGDDGPGQAWRRYLPDVRRDTRDSRDSAGQSSSEPRQARDSRDTAETAEIPFDQPIFNNVSPVPPVSRINGFHFADPPCYHCDKPVIGRHQDERGRYSHFECERKAADAQATNLTRTGVLASLAELELELGRERRLAAREARRARGQHIGRPKALDAKKAGLAQRMYASGESASTIANALGVSRATVYRLLAEQAAQGD